MGSLLMGLNYESLNFRDKKKAFLNSLLKICEYNVAFSENKCKYLPRGTKNCNAYPEFKVYTLKETDEQLEEGTFFDSYNFNPEWNTRDILLSEAVIELEGKDPTENCRACFDTFLSLMKNKIHFAAFYAEGMRAPHIHIYGLFPDVQDWAEKEMSMAIFCRKIIPFEYFHLIDKALWGQHTIALEFSKHWRHGHINKVFFEYVPEVTP